MKPKRWQMLWAFALLVTPTAWAESRRFDLGGGIQLELVLIPKGSFTMGSPESEGGRNPDEKAHPVTLSRDFFLGQTPVTRGQWERFTTETGYRSEAETGSSGGFGWNGSALEQKPGFTWRNPGFTQTPEHPVVMVTWEDAGKFTQWLSRKTGWTFDLPSEAQWEYACRAGTSSAWWTGDDPVTAGIAIWSKESSENQTQPVSARAPNPWGLHIAGNVWEWCADWLGPYDSLSGTDPLQLTPPAGEKPRRVLRGGSWLRPLKDTRSAARYRNDARSRNADNGFRVMSFGSPAQSTAVPAASPTAAPPASPPTLELETSDPGKLPPVAGGTSAPPRPISHSTLAAPFSGSPPAKPRSFFPWLLLLLFGLAVAWIVRRIFRTFTALPPLPSRIPRQSMGPTPPPPLNGPLNLAPGAFLTRPVHDGFWLNAAYAAGTWLNVSWRDEHGLARERRIQYAPGEDGHFIYTGSVPEEMRIREDEAGAIPPLPLPAPLPAPASEDDFLSTPPGSPSSSSGSPRRHRPSAY